MKIANNPIAQKLAAHFMERGAKRLWKGEIQCVHNREFDKEAERIRRMIEQKYGPFNNRKRNTFTSDYFLQLIIPNKNDPTKSFRNPGIGNLYKLCDVLGWNFQDLWIDKQSHINLNEIPELKRWIITTVEESTDVGLLIALPSMIEAITGKKPPQRQTNINEGKIKGSLIP